MATREQQLELLRSELQSAGKAPTSPQRELLRQELSKGRTAVGEVQPAIQSQRLSLPLRAAQAIEQSPIGKVGGAILDFGTGAIKELIDVPRQAAALGAGVGTTLAKGLFGKQAPQPTVLDESTKRAEFTKPVGTAEKAGAIAAQIGEFALPGVAGLSTGAKAPLLARAAGSAIESGAVTALQTGGNQKDIVRNALIAGALPIVSAAVKPMAKSIGLKIETSLIKPTKPDIADGFKTENIFKYELGGTLQQSAEKAHTKIQSLSDDLTQAIGASNKKLDLNSILDDTAKDLRQTKMGSFGLNTKVQKAVDFLKDEIKAVTDDGVVSLTEAQQIKRSVGKLGAWQYGVRDPEANALERAANAFYTKLKGAIEKSSPANVAGINKQLSELIPIENALVRRLPIAERNNLLGLGDLVSLVPSFTSASNFWLFALNKLAKSGLAAEKAFTAGTKGLGAKGALIKGAILRGAESPNEVNNR